MLACFDFQGTSTLVLEFEGLGVLPPIFLISEEEEMHSFISLQYKSFLDCITPSVNYFVDSLN